MLDVFKPEVNRRPLFVLERLYAQTDGKLILDGEYVNLETINRKLNTNFSSEADVYALIYRMPALPRVYWDYVRGLGENPMPSNVVFSFTKAIESLEFPGFYLIPTYSNYLINREGIVIKRSTGELVTASKTSLGYYTYRLTNDLNITANKLRHRIKAYVFKPYNADVENMEVNHINGVPGDDDLDNLEWVTRSGNTDHAYRTGLRSDNKPVEVRDLLADEVYTFHSYSAAGRFLEVTETTISNRCKVGPSKNYGLYQFRDLGSKEEWGDFTSKGGYEFNGERITATAAAKLLGITRTSFLRAIRGKNELIRNDKKVIRSVPLGSNS